MDDGVFHNMLSILCVFVVMNLQFCSISTKMQITEWCLPSDHVLVTHLTYSSGTPPEDAQA